MIKYILALDQGTTSSRSILYDQNANPVDTAQKEFKQIFPKPGWVEHDATEIWKSQLKVTKDVIKNHGINAENIVGIGITNQRETTVVWNRETGVPVYNAIVWQDRRTAGYCDQLKKKGWVKKIAKKTGLVLDAYFSGTKLKWILDHVKGARKMAESGELAFGTIDTWLIWNLTGGKTHVTDVSNASRTLLFNINTLQWDEDLLKLFDIPKSLLPEVTASSGEVGVTEKKLFGAEIPISGIAGDQQAALFGQMCTKPGMAKSTYGTGCFLMLNTGNKPVKSKNKLLTTIAWKIGKETTYALEGSVFIGGAVIQWIRDELEFFEEASDSEKLAKAAKDNGGVYFVPALTGLGAPYWDQYARGAIFGITRGTTKGNLTRAALESICFQVNDVLSTMGKDTGNKITELRVDGGAVANNLLVQFQADISGIDVIRPTNLETTALGAAYLAGIGCGLWNEKMLNKKWHKDRTFVPAMAKAVVNKHLKLWNKAVSRTLSWEEPEDE
jgi:glycerol kinase